MKASEPAVAGSLSRMEGFYSAFGANQAKSYWAFAGAAAAQALSHPIALAVSAFGVPSGL